MATSRDVKMTLSVETLGKEDIQALQKSIQQLATEGGEAAPEFQRLADEVARLGEQQQALATFRALGEQTEALSAKQEQAVASATQLRERLATLTTAAEDARAAQRAAADALLAGQKAYNDAGTAIRVLKTEYDNAGKQTAEYRAELGRLVAAQGAAGNSLVDLRAQQAAANKALSEAEGAQTKATTAYGRLTAQVERGNAALVEQTRVFKEAGDAAQVLGVETDNIAVAEARLVTSLNAAGAAARSRKASIDEMVESDRLLAIEERTLADLADRGRVALQAEEAAQREAARATDEYRNSLIQLAAAKEKATQDAAQWQRDADAMVDAAEAARRLNRDTQILVETQRELAAQRVFEQQAADARKLQQAGEYVRFWTTELDRAEAATRQVQDAFNTLNVRSADTIRAEIAQVEAALSTVRAQATATGSTMAGAFTAGQARIQGLQRELRELNGTLTVADRAARLFSNSLGQISAGNLIADGVGYLINKVKEGAVEFLNANLQVQRFSKSLTQVYGSATVAAQQLAFVRQTANDAGVSVSSISDAFVRFAASSKGAGISLEDNNRIFESVTRAAGTLGLTSEQVTGTLEALGQMASKGTVSMEELRQQLGDRLPGATAIAAQSLGVTSERLIQMVEAGNVSARVFLPAFADALRQTFGSGNEQITGFIQGWNRLANAIREVAQRASETSIFTTLGATFDAVARNIDRVVLGITLLAERFLVLKAIDIASTFVRTAGAAAQSTAATAANTTATVANTVAKTANQAATVALTTGLTAATAAKTGAATAMTALSTATTALGAGMRSLLGLVGGLPGVLALVALNARELGTWIGESIAKMGEAGEKMRAYEEAQRRQAEADRLAADQKRQMTMEQDRLNLAVSEGAVKARQAAEVAVTNSEKEVKAQQARIEVANTLAAISGREEDALMAAAEAARDLLAVNTAVVEAKNALVQRTQEEIEAIELTRDATGKLTEKQQEQIDKLQGLLAGRRAEADEAKATADKLSLEAVQRQLMSDLYRDNADRVNELAQAYEDALTHLETLRLAGTATAEQLALANAKVAASSRLLSDGYADAAAKIRLKSEAEQADLQLKAVLAGAEEQRYELLARTSRAQGDYTQAIYFEIQAKRQQIEVARLNMEMKTLESEAATKALEIQKQEIAANDPLREQKLAELDVRLKLEKVKLAEAGAGKEVIAAYEREIAAMLSNSQTRANTRAGIDSDTSSRQRNAQAIDQQTAALERQQGLTSDGFKRNADGAASGTFNNVIPVDKAFAAVKGHQDRTLTAGDLEMVREAAKQALNQKEFLDAVNPAFVSLSARQGSNGLVASTQNALQYVEGLVREQEAQKNKPAGGSAGTTTRGAMAPTPVNITIGGRRSTVNTASAADAQALAGVLQQLESQAGTAA